MQTPDQDQEVGLVDLTGLSLDDLAALDDSVVANAIRLLRERRCNGADYMETFSQFGAAP
jgi:FXSXX-COOH protein